MKHLAILGAGGHGKVVADAALGQGWARVTFFDDAWPERSAAGPWPVQGDTAALMDRAAGFQGVVVAIGDNRTRLAKTQKLLAHDAEVATVVHPAATVSQWATLGRGTVVGAGAAVNVDAVVGQACIVNTGATVDHDCRLGDGVHVCPGANLGGAVEVGEAGWIGIGAAVRHGVHLGHDVTVGAGAAVVSDISAGLTVVGIPAKPRPGSAHSAKPRKPLSGQWRPMPA